MNRCKRVKTLAAVLALSMTFSLFGNAAAGGDTREKFVTTRCLDDPDESYSIAEQLTDERWSSPVASYVYSNADGSICLVRANDKANVKIQTFTSDFELTDTKELPAELPIFGCFFSGKTYNYLAFGQENEAEDDSAEVIRIVKYDKSFHRLGSLSVRNCYTSIPFDAGSARIAENGDTIVLHTSRQRYLTEDGLHHQSQLTIVADMASMTVKNSLEAFQSNHVSHSFNQFVLYDGDKYVLLDHGDAFPRSVILQDSEEKAVSLYPIEGPTGANCTGVCVGGFEASDSSYLAAINAVDPSKITAYDSYEMTGSDTTHRDIILCVLPKSGTAAKRITLQKYAGTDRTGSAPQLVKISDSKLIVLWNEKTPGVSDFADSSDEMLKYVFVNQDGEPLSDVKSVGWLRVSACKPVVVGDSLVWAFSKHFGLFENSYLARLQLSGESAGLPSYQNFTKTGTYVSGSFSDVNEGQWYGTQKQGVIKRACELGIMNGVGGGRFDPDGSITYAQAVKMAAVVHDIFTGGSGSFEMGNPWYQVYQDYAVNNAIAGKTNTVENGYFRFDPNQKATRLQVAQLFYAAIPSAYLEKINNIDQIPDSSDAIVMALYRAGVLTGDANRCFNSYSPITRAEAAAIVARLVIPESRVRF